MILDLPDVRQAREYDCGDAAARCVAQFHGVKAPPAVATATDGTDPRTLEAAFRRAGLHVVSGNATLGDLKRWCNDGRPVICLVNFEGDDDSHYVTVAGVRRGRVHFQDPEAGPGAMDDGEFMLAWKASGRLAEAYCRWAVVAYPA